MQRIYLVRHGRTAWNLEQRYTGQADPPLDEAGRDQARRLASYLADVRFDQAIASDLARARVTAEHILAGRGIEAVLDPRLREASFGQWEGLTYAEVSARFPAEVRAWGDYPLGAAPPGGEALSSMAGRAAAVLGEIRERGEGRSMLVVTHGGPARVLICAVLGLPPAEQWRVQLDPGALATLEFHGDDGILCRLGAP